MLSTSFQVGAGQAGPQQGQRAGAAAQRVDQRPLVAGPRRDAHPLAQLRHQVGLVTPDEVTDGPGFGLRGPVRVKQARHGTCTAVPARDAAGPAARRDLDDLEKEKLMRRPPAVPVQAWWTKGTS